jgi:cyclic-di-GMP-binding protein
MAKMQSFDVTTGVDFAEVQNAVHQALKEITTRYDFKSLRVSIDIDEKEKKLVLAAPDDFKIKAMWEVLQTKLIRRGQAARNFHPAEIKPAGGGTARQEIDIVQGLPIELCRAIVKDIKDAKMKKVQVAIQGDTVRISGPSRDDLQEAIAFLKDRDYKVELKFENFRSQ